MTLELGDRLQRLRKGMGLSQEELAGLLGVSRQAVSKWETNQSVPELDNVLQLSRVLGVSADELLGNPARSPETPSPAAYCVRAGLARRVFTAGIAAALTGAALLAAELILLVFIKHAEIRSAIERGAGYWPETWQYARQFPMLLVFALTGAVLIAGAALAVYGLFLARRAARG